MTAEDALAKQIELYRRMTGGERLEIALPLHTFACDVTRDGIRHQRSDASDEEVERERRRRLELARS